MNLEQTDNRIGTFIQTWWQGLPAKTRRNYRVISIGWLILWVSGAIQAPTVVAGIARLDGILKWGISLCMGGWVWLWRLLKATGQIQESQNDPHLLWIFLMLSLPTALYFAFVIFNREASPQYVLKKQQAHFAQSQGRRETAQIVDGMGMEKGIPLAFLTQNKAQIQVGLPHKTNEEHTLVIAPTRGGKGLHLTETLLQYPSAVIVIDPKGEQFTRTAASRSRLGPIYRLPGHQIQLGKYYQNLLDEDDVIVLHQHLLRPWASRESIFADKALSLFFAAGEFARAIELDSMRVLLDTATDDPIRVFRGMETVPNAKKHIRIFTNGAAPGKFQDDRFVTSALGNFTTRLLAYQKHIDTIAPTQPNHVIPPNWAAQNATIYITYNLQDLQGAGGVIAAILMALIRQRMKQADSEKMLVAIDELPALGLRDINRYLATCGGYGINLLLYAQSLDQLIEIYGKPNSNVLLDNCAHQVWYVPNELTTAEKMSALYGQSLVTAPSHSQSRAQYQQNGQALTRLHHTDSQAWREQATLSPTQIMGLSEETVLVKTKQKPFPTIFLGERLNLIARFSKLSPPDILRLPQPQRTERVYTNWALPDTTQATSPEEVL